jgi:hypothetical protein
LGVKRRMIQAERPDCAAQRWILAGCILPEIRSPARSIDAER